MERNPIVGVLPWVDQPQARTVRVNGGWLKMREVRVDRSAVSPEEQRKTEKWHESVRDSMRELGASQANVGLVVLVAVTVAGRMLG